MTALFAGLTTLDVLHRLDHVPDPLLKVTSTDFTMAAGGPATNAAVTYAALNTASRVLSDSDDEAGATSYTAAASGEAPMLLTALGEGPVSAFLAADLAAAGVRVLDATALAAPSTESTEADDHPATPEQRDATPASSPASSPAGREPAVSSIIEHPSGRMVASTNARLDADAGRVAAHLPERVGAVLIDGHNPALAYAALTLGVPKVDGEDPFAQLEARPPHPRILDGGSWKDWLTPLLGFVDIAVVSEDFAPPLMARPDGAQVAEFLRGFGITRTVRTRGDRSVQYWWDGTSGEVPVEAVPEASTLGAGDAFHGAFTWAIERGGDSDPEGLIRFASAVAAVSVSSFGTRQWLASPSLLELVRGW
ncbi:PfkB family carbohydrate kinase [Pauljensenia sp. 20925_1_27]